MPDHGEHDFFSLRGTNLLFFLLVEPASFGILVCGNKTISAVYCPKGTLGSKSKVYSANTNRPKDSPSRSLAYMDIISMDSPCPKPVKKDIDNALKELTCRDREKVEGYFDLGFYGNAALALDLHNTDGDCTDEGRWHDKCTSVGTFCGKNIFGCNTVDDAIYQCDAIGDKPKKIAMCPRGECVSKNGSATCQRKECHCSGSGQVKENGQLNVTPFFTLVLDRGIDQNIVPDAFTLVHQLQ